MVAVNTFQIMLIRAGKVHWTMPVVDFPSETICMKEEATSAVVFQLTTNLMVKLVGTTYCIINVEIMSPKLPIIVPKFMLKYTPLNIPNLIRR